MNGKYNCLGRFTPNGFEIYHNMNVLTEVVGTTKTLDIQTKPTDEKSWRNFVTLMKQHHAIDLSAEAYPATEVNKNA